VTDITKLLQRQAEWQKVRAALSWAGKIRMAEAVREDVGKLRRARPPMTGDVAESKDPGTGESQSQRCE